MILRLSALLILVFVLSLKSFAWEDNSWSLDSQNDEVFDELVSMQAYTIGLDNLGMPSGLSVSCKASNGYWGEKPNQIPTPGGPLLVLLVVDFDVWFGHNLAYLNFEGRYQIDKQPTEKILAKMNTIIAPNGLRSQNKTIIFDPKRNPNLIKSLMSGERLVLKPWEGAVLDVMNILSPGNPTELDLNQFLKDENLPLLKDRVLRYSLKDSKKNIQKVISFCQPFVKKWERELSSM